jgi:hypothetical protein
MARISQKEREVLLSLLGQFELPRRGPHKRLMLSYVQAFETLKTKQIISIDGDGNISFDKDQVEAIVKKASQPLTTPPLDITTADRKFIITHEHPYESVPTDRMLTIDELLECSNFAPKPTKT